MQKVISATSDPIHCCCECVASSQSHHYPSGSWNIKEYRTVGFIFILRESFNKTIENDKQKRIMNKILNLKFSTIITAKEASFDITDYNYCKNNSCLCIRWDVFLANYWMYKSTWNGCNNSRVHIWKRDKIPGQGTSFIGNQSRRFLFNLPSW